MQNLRNFCGRVRVSKCAHWRNPQRLPHRCALLSDIVEAFGKFASQLFYIVEIVFRVERFRGVAPRMLRWNADYSRCCSDVSQNAHRFVETLRRHVAVDGTSVSSTWRVDDES